MFIAKLLDTKGRQIEHPAQLEGSFTWNAAEGRAMAWGPDGKTLMAEMRNARIQWVTHVGMRLEGVEPFGSAGDQVRAQQWQVNFDKL